jgi:quercetin dioxygenase-like cupin family protein
MQLVRWTEVATEKISPNVHRQVIWGEQATLARFFFAQDAHVSAHKHESEQHTCVVAGAIRARIAGEEKEVIVRAGEVLLIPGGVEHEVWALEDSEVVDFFAPARRDWLVGAHQYLAGR